MSPSCRALTLPPPSLLPAPRRILSLTHHTVLPPPTPQGDYEYYHRTTFVAAKTKPLLLGNTEWDPDWVPTWSIARVALFLRRIGLKQYCHTFYDYGVDGLLLLKVRAPQMSFLVWFGLVWFGLCGSPLSVLFSLPGGREEGTRPHFRLLSRCLDKKVFAVPSPLSLTSHPLPHLSPSPSPLSLSFPPSLSPSPLSPLPLPPAPSLSPLSSPAPSFPPASPC